MEGDVVSRLKLTRQGALKIMDAVYAAAGEKAAKMSVAIVDDGGNLILFSRSDNAGLTTQNVAITKARAAAMTRMPSGKKSAAPAKKEAIITPWRSRWPQGWIGSAPWKGEFPSR